MNLCAGVNGVIDSIAEYQKQGRHAFIASHLASYNIDINIYLVITNPCARGWGPQSWSLDCVLLWL